MNVNRKADNETMNMTSDETFPMKISPSNFALGNECLRAEEKDIVDIWKKISAER